jgi:hypothetical protein
MVTKDQLDKAIYGVDSQIDELLELKNREIRKTSK